MGFMNTGSEKEFLNICLISYRSNPHCGGQGVYIRNLSRALIDLGHSVEVVSGPPDPMLNNGIKLTMLPCLDLYNPEDMFRIPSFPELMDPVNIMEWVGVSTMGFPEPFTFGFRAYRYLRRRFASYDIVHDNQSLSYGIWAIKRFVPTVATIHHPITVDRRIAIRSARPMWRKMQQWRWFSFVGMQKRVARRLPQIITVSQSAVGDIGNDFVIPPSRFRIVPNGIDTKIFHPVSGVAREQDRIIVTNSADVPLKGLHFFLRAIADIAKNRRVRVTIIGTPKNNGVIVKLIRDLGISHVVKFTGRIDNEEFIRQYARSGMAVIPSIYEGFGLPAGEAMACGVPVISTTCGALPEVVGNAGLLVPPADTGALSRAIIDLLDHPDKAAQLGQDGYNRICEHFTWKRAAEKTVAAYREVISGYS
jgi:MMP alpha-(1->4)-mannosyltransferase